MRWALGIAAIALVVGFALGGSAPLGRVLMATGLPGLAAPLFEDPAWRGAALYRAGRYDEAAQAFRAANDPFNLGNAMVMERSYAAALEAYDQALKQPDADAQANFDLVSAHYASLGINADALSLTRDRNKEGPKADSFIARGDARAAGTGTEVTNTNTMFGLAQLDSRGRLGVRKVFDDKFIVADDRWLAQLSDVPGAFLKARITHQYKRRVADGTAPPEPEDPT